MAVKGFWMPWKSAAVGGHRRGLAVHQSRGRDHPRAEGLPDRLVPEADPQDRDAPGEALDGRHGDARILRPSGPGRDDQAARLERLELVHGQAVVAQDAHLGAHLHQVLVEVVGERVEVVDHDQHGNLPKEGSRFRVHGCCSTRMLSYKLRVTS